MSTSTGIFSSSTHARDWLWKSEADLNAQRARSQLPAKERCRRLLQAQQAQQQKSQQVAEEKKQDLLSAMSDTTAAATAATVAAPSTKKSKNAPGAIDPAQYTPLTLDEERQLRIHYLLQLHQMSSILRLPIPVTHTSLIFFQRFYLTQSIMEYPPKEITYTCIYLACKVEEYHLPVEKMIAEITKASGGGEKATAKDAIPVEPAVHAPAPVATPASASSSSQTVSAILRLEVPLLTALKFQMRLFHLLRASRGLILELEEFDTSQMSLAIFANAHDPALTCQDAPGTTLQSTSQFLSSRAQALHDSLLITDALFLYTPAQMALACLMRAEQEAKQYAIDLPKAQVSIKTLDVVERYVKRAAGSQPASTSTSAASSSAHNPATLLAKLDSILTYLTQGINASSTIDKKSLKAIEKRRKLITNRVNDPLTQEAQAERMRTEEREEERREKREGKMRHETRKMEDALLMDENTTTNVSAAPTDSSEFHLSKRQKSAAPSTASGEDKMSDIPSMSPPKARGLAAQFDETME